MDFPAQHGLPVAHPVCASWVSALVPSTLTTLSQGLCTKPGGRGQLKGCVKDGGEMMLKAIALKLHI